MALSLDDVQRIAQLARIQIDDSQTREMHGKLVAILALVDELQSIDTSGVVPMSHAQDLTAPLRDDAVTEPDCRIVFQQVAPAVEDGLYLVPRVIE